MNPEPSPDFLVALRDLLEALDELGAPAMIIGGLAVIATGVPRSTVDIDATIAGVATTPEQILEAFSRHGILPRIENALELARSRQVVLGLHTETDIAIDLSLAWLPFEAEALENCLRFDYRGLSLPFPRPEDLLIYKLVAHRPKDIEDAEKIFALHRVTISSARVRHWIEQFSAALEDDSRLQTLERILRR